MAKQPDISGPMSEDQVKALVHELQVHQIELEMQNEELKRARNEAEKLKEQYLDLYDFSPVGYFAFDILGTILSVNLTGASLLGMPRSALVGRRFQLFIDPGLRTTISERVREIIETGEKRTFEMTILREGELVYLQIEGIAVELPGGKEKQCRAAVIDITERKKSEAREKDLEQHKLEFYRNTIIAATNGKLVITDRSEIERIAGPSAASWEIRSRGDLPDIRHRVEEAAVASGMEEARIAGFVLVTGEAATNALKHAGGGTVSLHRLPDALMLVFSDRGPGIAAMSLPDIALREGYSTAGTLGMGYKVMLRVADRVYLATDPEGTTVGTQFSLHPSKYISLADLTPVTLSTCTDWQ